MKWWPEPWINIRQGTKSSHRFLSDTSPVCIMTLRNKRSWRDTSSKLFILSTSISVSSFLKSVLAFFPIHRAAEHRPGFRLTPRQVSSFSHEKTEWRVRTMKMNRKLPCLFIKASRFVFNVSNNFKKRDSRKSIYLKFYRPRGIMTTKSDLTQYLLTGAHHKAQIFA